MSQLQDRVNRATVFRKLALNDRYYLVRSKEGDKWKTAFRTHYGLFEYPVIPFRWANAPSTLQNLMNEVLLEFLDQGMVVYHTNILTYSGSREAHEVLASKVLQ